MTAQNGGAGQGSTFTVTLPVIHPEESVAAPPAENLQAAAGPRQRILVVDDNRDGAESLAMMLELLNNDVQIAYDGVEAVRRADYFGRNLSSWTSACRGSMAMRRRGASVQSRGDAT